MMIDAFLPEGVTMMAVDSIFMMPQLGVLSEVMPQAATEVFDKDCLIRLGTCVAPSGPVKKQNVLAVLRMTMPDGSVREEKIVHGQLRVLELGVGEKVNATISPVKGIDVGNDPGREWEGSLEGGVVGLILDGRGRRPFELPVKDTERVQKLQEWSKALDTYPDRYLSLGGGDR